jgi:acyl carrier protein
MPLAEPISFMQTADIDREVRSFLVERFLAGHAENLRDDGSLLGGVVDSLGVLALVTYLQDHFKITVEDEDVVPGNLDTVNNLVAFVARKLDGKR